MLSRALLAAAALALALVACGTPQKLNQNDICGGQPCDSCVGAACPDAGVDAGH